MPRPAAFVETFLSSPSALQSSSLRLQIYKTSSYNLFINTFYSNPLRNNLKMSTQASNRDAATQTSEEVKVSNAAQQNCACSEPECKECKACKYCSDSKELNEFMDCQNGKDCKFCNDSKELNEFVVCQNGKDCKFCNDC